MSNQVLNQSPYLRTTRTFPPDIQKLSVESDRAYIDIANAVNDRVIGIYATNRPVINGETYFLTSNRQNALRQVYTFSSAGNIAHGIDTSRIGGFVRIYGTFTDGTTWYPLPYVNVVSATNQVSVVVNATNIVITAGAGTPPTITSGTVVLEWIAAQ